MTAPAGPDPDRSDPVPGIPRLGFLRPIAAGRPTVSVGRFTYYDDPEGPGRFFERNVLHHYEEVGDRLVIGAFCALATGVTFFMNGANHATAGFSTYPFEIFHDGWETGFDPALYADAGRGDTVVGHDVWLGHGALVLPGVTVGSGAIVGARAVVARDVPDYAVVTGNPATVRRMRFEPGIVAALLRIAWWDWPVDRITAHLAAIRGGDLAALERAAAP